MNDSKKVLVIEDESSIRKFITINLNNNGFLAFEAVSGEDALNNFDSLNPDIVVLDIMLPGIDGYEVCQQIRQKRNDVIIIMLTAKTQDMDKILGLELGADDYMVKPFNPLELVARIRAILRRTGKIKENNREIITYKNLTLDLRSQKFLKNGREIVLTPIEFSLIKTFIENAGAALSRDELLNIVWGENYFGDVKTVDVHIRRLREKIEENPSEPQFIETVWGYGYRWQREN